MNRYFPKLSEYLGKDPSSMTEEEYKTVLNEKFTDVVKSIPKTQLKNNVIRDLIGNIYGETIEREAIDSGDDEFDLYTKRVKKDLKLPNAEIATKNLDNNYEGLVKFNMDKYPDKLSRNFVKVPVEINNNAMYPRSTTLHELSHITDFKNNYMGDNEAIDDTPIRLDTPKMDLLGKIKNLYNQKENLYNIEDIDRKLMNSHLSEDTRKLYRNYPFNRIKGKFND